MIPHPTGGSDPHRDRPRVAVRLSCAGVSRPDAARLDPSRHGTYAEARSRRCVTRGLAVRESPAVT